MIGHPASMILAGLLAALVGSPSNPQEAALSGRFPFEASEWFLSATAKLDLALILRSWRIVGFRSCARPPHCIQVCVEIENAWPVGLLEVVRTPGRTHLLEMAAPMAALGSPLVPWTGSSHSPNASDGTGLQFAEAHVFPFSPQLPLIEEALPLVIPEVVPYGIAYLSEIDGFFWRSGLAEWLLEPGAMATQAALGGCSTLPRLETCAGTWGGYTPRIGFAVHPSEVIAAYLQALRAGRVAAAPAGRIAWSPYPYEPRTGHYVQMLRPSLREGIPIGFPWSRPIEAGALSPQGAYLFVHYGIFRACKGCWSATLAPARAPIF